MPAAESAFAKATTRQAPPPYSESFARASLPAVSAMTALSAFNRGQVSALIAKSFPPDNRRKKRSHFFRLCWRTAARRLEANNRRSFSFEKVSAPVVLKRVQIPLSLGSCFCFQLRQMGKAAPANYIRTQRAT
jgi:hypothetical protein